MTLASAPADARDSAERAVRDARAAVTRDPDAHDPDGAAAATALATALTARHYVLWGSQDPADALAAADEIVTAVRRQRARDRTRRARPAPDPHARAGRRTAAQRVLPELDRMADALRPAARLATLSRRSTLAALTGDFASAIECARQAFETGQAAGARPSAATRRLGARPMLAHTLRDNRAPAAADRLDQAVRTGTRCSYSPPDRQS